MRTAAVLAAALSAAALLAPAGASAIPAFARKYRVSCTTCHDPFPRLKPYGEEFAARGFAMEPAQEPPRATLDVGDELLQLPRDFPIAVRLDAFGQWTPGADPQTAFQAPWVFKILTGGKIADKVSWYTYFIIEQGEVVGLSASWLHGRNVRLVGEAERDLEREAWRMSVGTVLAY